MSRYQGPRLFTTTDAALQRELQKLASELDRAFAEQQDGTTWRLAYAPVVRANAALQEGAITPVDALTSTPPPTILLTLPAWDVSMAGLPLGVERREVAATVQVRPRGNDLLNDVNAALALPATRRVFLFVATPLGWKAVASA